MKSLYNKFSSEKIIKFSYKYIFLINLIVVFVAYGLLINKHYSTDTYKFINGMDPKQYLIFGRIMTYLIYTLLNKININVVLYQPYFTLLYIVILAFIMTIMVKLAELKMKNNEIKNILLITFSIQIVFVNVFFHEWFLFSEAIFSFCIGSISVLLAIFFINKNRELKNIIISFIFLLMSLSIYQANIGFFVILGLTYMLIQNRYELNLESIKQTIILLFIGLMASFINIKALDVMQKFNIVEATSRNVNIELNSIIENIKYIAVKGQYDVWVKGLGFMPKYSILIFGSILILILIHSIYKNNLNIKSIVFILIIMSTNYLIIFVPHVLTETVWMAPRSIVAFFTFLSAIVLIIIDLNKQKQNGNKLFIILLIFICVNLFQIQNISLSHFETNKIDKEYANLIYKKIYEYEKKNTIEIKNIATKNDIEPTYGYYNSVEYIGYNTNVRALVVSWSDVNVINYASGRSFNKVEMNDEIYNKYFNNKNWDNLNLDEQLIFDGDTAFLIMY